MRCHRYLIAGVTLAIIGLASMAFGFGPQERGAQRQGQGQVAKTFVRKAAEPGERPPEPEYVEKGIKPKDRRAAELGYVLFNNWDVTTIAGKTCGNTRGSKLSVYAGDVRWRYATRTTSVITSPTGTGTPAGAGFHYEGAKQLGIVVRLKFDGRVYFWDVGSTDPDNPTIINLPTNTMDVNVTVNDRTDTYGDNWGSYDIYFRVDER